MYPFLIVLLTAIYFFYGFAVVSLLDSDIRDGLIPRIFTVLFWPLALTVFLATRLYKKYDK